MATINLQSVVHGHLRFLRSPSLFIPHHCNASFSSSFSPLKRIHCSPFFKAGTCRALASKFELPTKNYEFHDGKGEVELKVKLPDGNKNIGASNVFVDAQDTSITVTLALPSSLLNVFPCARLYGRIKPSETVWFLDEEEIVISLKKHDKELVWPGLLENWETLTEGVSGLLKGVPVYVVGESSDINWAVAKKLAEGLEYILMLCPKFHHAIAFNSLSARRD